MVFSSTRSGGFGEGDLYLTLNEEGEMWRIPSAKVGPLFDAIRGRR